MSLYEACDDYSFDLPRVLLLTIEETNDIWAIRKALYRNHSLHFNASTVKNVTLWCFCEALILNPCYILNTEWRTYVSVKWALNISSNCLPPVRSHAITRINIGLLPIGPLGTNVSETWKWIHTNFFLKVSSVKWHPFYSDLKILSNTDITCMRRRVPWLQYSTVLKLYRYISLSVQIDQTWLGP